MKQEEYEKPTTHQQINPESLEIGKDYFFSNGGELTSSPNGYSIPVGQAVSATQLDLSVMNLVKDFSFLSDKKIKKIEGEI